MPEARRVLDAVQRRFSLQLDFAPKRFDVIVAATCSATSGPTWVAVPIPPKRAKHWRGK